MRVLTEAEEARVYAEFVRIKAQPTVASLCAKWNISRQLLHKVVRRQRGKSR